MRGNKLTPTLSIFLYCCHHVLFPFICMFSYLYATLPFIVFFFFLHKLWAIAFYFPFVPLLLLLLIIHLHYTGWKYWSVLLSVHLSLSWFPGMLQCEPGQVRDKNQIFRLFCHECQRVFHDRLINNQDKTYFNTIVCEMASKNSVTKMHKQISS